MASASTPLAPTLSPTWFDILVTPFTSNYPVILIAAALCFIFQSTFATLSQKVLFPQVYASLSKEDRRAWNVRMVAFVHAIIAFSCVPGFLFPDPVVRNDPYAYSPFSQFIFSVAAGYFLWDIVVCVRYKWGVMLFCHGVTCFLVFYLALHPFLHHVGRFYLGVYEMSTPCLHVYKMLQLAGRSNTMLCKIMGLVFAFLFTTARILLGIPYSIFWAQHMVQLIKSGGAHSVAVVSLYLAANFTLNLLNILWWGAILKIILKGFNIMKRPQTRADEPKM